MAFAEVEQPEDPDGSAGLSLTTSQRRDRIVPTAAALGLIILAWPALLGTAGSSVISSICGSRCATNTLGV